jgi:hypothetical protein
MHSIIFLLQIFILPVCWMLSDQLAPPFASLHSNIINKLTIFIFYLIIPVLVFTQFPQTRALVTSTLSVCLNFKPAWSQPSFPSLPVHPT